MSILSWWEDLLGYLKLLPLFFSLVDEETVFSWAFYLCLCFSQSSLQMVSSSLIPFSPWTLDSVTSPHDHCHLYCDITTIQQIIMVYLLLYKSHRVYHLPCPYISYVIVSILSYLCSIFFLLVISPLNALLTTKLLLSL